MYVVNLEYYGHLVNADHFNPLLKRPDLYMLLTNQLDWEQRYIHPEYPRDVETNKTFKQVTNNFVKLNYYIICTYI